MAEFDILITMDNDVAQFATSLSAYLDDHAYSITYNQSKSHWAWIPIITRSERRRLVDWFEMMQNEDVVILPILLDDTRCPTAFEARFTIKIDDVRGELQPYFDKLEEHLSNGRQLLNKLTQLNAHYQDFNQQLQNSPRNLNLIRYLKDLQQQIDLTHNVLISPRGKQDTNENIIWVGVYDTIHKLKRIRLSERYTAHIVGNPPPPTDTAQNNWTVDVVTANNYLLDDDPPKVVTILGQAEDTNSAIACHILHSFAYYHQMEKILYLNASDNNEPLTLERLFKLTGKAFGGAVGEILSRVWQDERMTLDMRISYLIDQYTGDRCLFVFDNIHEKLSANGQFTDLGLAQFFDQFLTRVHHAQILMTSRIPLFVADDHVEMTKIVPVSAGLCDRTATDLLYEFDKEGILGLRGADALILADILKRTRGYPRALGAVVGLMANRPLMPIAKITDFTPLLNDTRLIADWVQRAEQVLDTDQRMMMQVLSIFVEPVDEIALRYVLAPYLESTGIDIPFTLKRLQRDRYILRDRLTDKISLHPLDKECYYTLFKAEDGMSAGERFFREMNILPLESEDTSENSFTRLALEKRVADFYSHLRGEPSDWQSISDLHPYLLEYEHRLRAEDYETSFTMLITVYSLLKLSGFSNKIAEMILPLIDNLALSYKITCLNMLGMAYDDLGHYQEALDCHLSALPLTRLDDNLPAEVAHLSGIGLQYSNLGEYEQALDHYEQALELSRNTDNRKQERSILNNMAVVYNSLGQKLEALSIYEDSLDIARDIDDTQGVAVTLANIGDSYSAIGDIDKTIACYQEAIDLYASIGDKIGRGITIGKMGNAAAMLGSYEDALKLLDVAVEIAEHAGNRLWEVLHHADIAAVHIQRGDIDKGLRLLERLLPDAEFVGTPIVMNYVYSLLAGAFLYSGQFKKAFAASERAIEYTNPSNQHYEYALSGLIQVRLEQVEGAQQAFTMSLDHAAELLENTPDLYSPKYSRGLALMGLALVTNDLSYADDAKVAYLHARENCDAKGVIRREMKKLNMLTWEIDDEDNSSFMDEFQK